MLKLPLTATPFDATARIDATEKKVPETLCVGKRTRGSETSHEQALIFSLIIVPAYRTRFRFPPYWVTCQTSNKNRKRGPLLSAAENPVLLETPLLRREKKGSRSCNWLAGHLEFRFPFERPATPSKQNIRPKWNREKTFAQVHSVFVTDIVHSNAFSGTTKEDFWVRKTGRNAGLASVLFVGKAAVVVECGELDHVVGRKEKVLR